MQRLAKFKLALFLVSSIVLANTHSATADTGDPELWRALAAVCDDQRLGIGSPAAAEAIVLIIARASELPNEAGQWLLPPGTTVDRVEWVGNVVEIDLTIPAAADDWYLSPLDQETISAALGSPFADDPAFGGTRTRARAGQDQPYGTLEQFLLPAPSRD
ncbi:MAG: hypothetical protein KKI02_10165, partial [Planctomycetes bacterium]|nr:hypothetical protein [Planctomycetota bacterium]